jgi:hypothetical protein
MNTDTLQIPYVLEDDGKIDFNIYGVPTSLLLNLARVLTNAYPIRSANEAAPSFKEERAKYIDKVRQAEHEKGFERSGQIFMDFPDS